ncbi:MAG TPA: DUF2065 domain-containing protein [Xanthomonadaceae bacterium]|nr:DUF2065 domain-containing protein [Xanthomonadaceae bacterium]
MSADLLAALCLVLVIEGLFLFAAPNAWKRAADTLRELPSRSLRIYGAVMIGLGLVLLQLVR